MENVQQYPSMHGIAQIPRSCLVMLTWLHVTSRQFPDIYIYIYLDQSRASNAQRLTELYYGIILQDHITEFYHGIILRDNMTELCYRSVLRDHITEEYHRIILLDYLME